MTARSFFTTTLEADGLAKTLVDARRSVGAHPSAGLLFVSGMPARNPAAIASVVRDAWKGFPSLVIPAAGVLHERGEVERTSAVSGIVWKGGQAEPFVIGHEPVEMRDALRHALHRDRAAAAPRPRTVLLFVRPDALHLSSFDGLADHAPDVCLFGAGTVGGEPALITSDGRVQQGRAVGLSLTGFSAPIMEESPGVRLVSSFKTVDEVEAGMILKIGGTPALDALSASTAGLRAHTTQGAAQPIVFAALADGPPDGSGRARFSVRNVRGIDPVKRGVLIGPEARVGLRCAFAVLDGAAAKADLERAARSLQESARGSAPRFALYLSCAGRGQGLYGAAEVESRILRQRFGDLPIAGMHSAFEIASRGAGRSTMQFFTGVLALFRSPS